MKKKKKAISTVSFRKHDEYFPIHFKIYEFRITDTQTRQSKKKTDILEFISIQWNSTQPKRITN